MQPFSSAVAPALQESPVQPKTPGGLLKGFLFGGAFLMALAVVELVASSMIGFPRRPRNREFVVNWENGQPDVVKWEQPHTRFWDVEGGNIVVELNNVGLPGTDIFPGADKRYVFVAGSSFVEATQVDREKIATSVFQKQLRAEIPGFEVLNLGFSSADPYALWFRCEFFRKYYEPSAVILVLDRRSTGWLGFHSEALKFSLCTGFGVARQSSGIAAVFRYLREKCALANMLSVVVMHGAMAPPVARPFEPTPENRDSLIRRLGDCLQAFHTEYPGKFGVVQLGSNHFEDSLVVERCRALGVPVYGGRAISRRENEFGGHGHLNEQGNLELGKALYETFCKMNDR
jgi:hypothetical protein